jgi:hypothetical protein
MADAERLMNLMESFDYKSEQYNVCRKVLLSHLAQKPKDDEEAMAWTMTGPAPFEVDLEPPVQDPAPPAPDPEPLPPPKPIKGKPRTASPKKVATPKAKAPKKATASRSKSVRKKSSPSSELPIDTTEN